jgi:hypothetical protein
VGLFIVSQRPFKTQLFEVYQTVERVLKSLLSCQFHGTSATKLAFWCTINLGFRPQQGHTPYYDRGIDFRFLHLSYRRNIIESFDNPAFFVATTGFIGLGPRWMKEQDQIVVFDGAETTFVLRETSVEAGTNAWKLVGDCYVDGWTDGWMDGICSGYAVVDEANDGKSGGRGDGGEKEAAHEAHEAHEARDTTKTLKSQHSVVC